MGQAYFLSRETLEKGEIGTFPQEVIVISEQKKEGIPEMHSRVADCFYLIEGDVEFVTGGELIGSSVASLDSTSWIGESITGGNQIKMKPGDFLFIPSNCPHQRITHTSSRLFLVKVPQLSQQL